MARPNLWGDCYIHYADDLPCAPGQARAHLAGPPGSEHEASRSGTQRLSLFARVLKLRKKSMAVAVFLWFFLGFMAAHKFYLGKTREGFGLILIYFFAPLIVLVVAVSGMSFLGIKLIPPDARPEEILAIVQGTKFLVLVTIAFIVLTGVWIWDLLKLIHQVRAHNARLANEIPEGFERKGAF